MKPIFIQILFTFLLVGCSTPQKGELIFIQPEAGDAFNYPYYLFIPDQVTTNESIYLIIEPNNSGITHDSLQKHIELAKLRVSKDFYIGNYVSRRLKIPLLVPVFPRPETQWQIYTHDLDRDVMLQKDNDLERIDKQLISMFEDARGKLTSRNIIVNAQFLLTGFSASGSFANRFTAIHPDKVAAVAAGGTGGLLILPVDSLKNEMLIFPNGVGDFKAITGREFQKDEFAVTPQFYFLGKLDDNDAVPYNDAYGERERKQIYRLFGEATLLQRWNQCLKTYADCNVNVMAKTYENIGHEHPESVNEDVFAFFKESIE